MNIMEKLYKLKETLMEELENLKTTKTGDLQAGELEALHKLTDTIKNIDKICMLESEGGYSADGMWEADMRGTYGRGSSYAGGGNNGSGGGRGGYSGEGGYSGRRGQRRNSRGQYSRNGYSMDGAKEEIMEHIDEMMESAPDDRTRDMIRHFKEQIERA